jgi:DNA-binding response OmpR family regulator
VRSRSCCTLRGRRGWRRRERWCGCAGSTMTQYCLTLICLKWTDRNVPQNSPRLPSYPNIMLTRDEEDDQVEPLDAGADDCVTKAISEQPTNRATAAIRHSKSETVETSTLDRHRKCRAEPCSSSCRRRRAGASPVLQEFEMLRHLIEHTYWVVPHNRLLPSL